MKRDYKLSNEVLNVSLCLLRLEKMIKTSSLLNFDTLYRFLKKINRTYICEYELVFLACAQNLESSRPYSILAAVVLASKRPKMMLTAGCN